MSVIGWVEPSFQTGAAFIGSPGWRDPPLRSAAHPSDPIVASMVSSGQGLDLIALCVGLDREAVLDRVVALDLPTPADRVLRPPLAGRGWAHDLYPRLAELWVRGVRSRVIGGIVGRSAAGVAAKARRIGLPRRARASLLSFDACVGVESGPGMPGAVPDLAAATISPPLILAGLTPTPPEPLVPAPAEAVADPTPACSEPPSPVLAKKEVDAGLLQGECRASSQIVWTPNLEDELADRYWAGQLPASMARDMGVSFCAITSKLHRLELPRRDRADLVDHYDREAAKANLAASGYVKRRCPFWSKQTRSRFKDRWFWAPRNGNRYSRQAKRLRSFRGVLNGMGGLYA